MRTREFILTDELLDILISEGELTLQVNDGIEFEVIRIIHDADAEDFNVYYNQQQWDE